VAEMYSYETMVTTIRLLGVTTQNSIIGIFTAVKISNAVLNLFFDELVRI
jgi:hypothetical protein